MKLRKAIIISISKKKLNNEEKKIFRNKKSIPWGVILFKRNIANNDQLRKLTMSIRKLTKDKNYPILIDEEGGKVCRLPFDKNRKKFSQKFFGDLFLIDKKKAVLTYKNFLNSLCLNLRNLGININTIPVLDLAQKNTHKIIGSRSYSKEVNIIQSLGKICIKILKKNKIFPVIKHLPGHGCSNKDSHKSLPIINKRYSKLIKEDFKCFMGAKSLLGMTAHIKLSKIDKNNVSTFSNKIITNIIRKKIGFKGILISDDISMKSLKYGLVDNSRKALDAGCNLILHCNGNIKEMFKLLEIVPTIDKFTQKKTSDFYKFLG